VALLAGAWGRRKPWRGEEKREDDKGNPFYLLPLADAPRRLESRREEAAAHCTDLKFPGGDAEGRADLGSARCHAGCAWAAEDDGTQGRAHPRVAAGEIVGSLLALRPGEQRR